MDANQVKEIHLGHVMKNNEYLWRIKSNTLDLHTVGIQREM